MISRFFGFLGSLVVDIAAGDIAPLLAAMDLQGNKFTYTNS
jgi:hypothetical protein